MNTIIQRNLNTADLGIGIALLNAVAVDHRTRLYFSAGDVAATGALPSSNLIGCIQDCQIIEVATESFNHTTSIPELALFEGQNTVIAQRMTESGESVAAWLAWHQKWHGLQGAVILDRAKPNSKDNLFKQLEADLRKAKVDGLTIVILNASVPLGKPDVGSEAHPMNAPDAPGKDRMTAPDCDMWTAPLAMANLYEMVKTQFVQNARAVMNIDVHDYLVPPAEHTVFDLAVQQGVVILAGEGIYPWNLRSGEEPLLADHVYRRFDKPSKFHRWCIAPALVPTSTTLRPNHIPHTPADAPRYDYWRCMALRYGQDNRTDQLKISQIVPKSSLVEDKDLLGMSHQMGHKPLRMQQLKLRKTRNKSPRTAIVTTMKNEGPFILEWLAYHRMIGVDDFIVYTNDCTDGTDTMLALLQEKGIVQPREYPFREMDIKPQHAALAASEQEEMIQDADWLICMDVDEFINVHVGDGTLAALYAAVPDANMISMTWRLFGNADVSEFEEGFITEHYTLCAPEMTRKPHQAWGFKTLYRNNGIFKKMGVHRPKGLRPSLKDHINWVNGSGNLMPETEFRNAWRSTNNTVGYDMVTLNHYALRSAESFLVKRDRGRVNHVDRDQGLNYWFRMNNNKEENHSIQRHLTALKVEFAKLMADDDIRKAHEVSVKAHAKRITELKATSEYLNLYKDLTGERLRTLSRMHMHFGSSIFLAGPDVIPDNVWKEEQPDNFFFALD